MLGGWRFLPLFRIDLPSTPSTLVSKLLVTDYQKVVVSVNVLKKLLQLYRQVNTHASVKTDKRRYKQHGVLYLAISPEVVVHGEYQAHSQADRYGQCCRAVGVHQPQPLRTDDKVHYELQQIDAILLLLSNRFLFSH